MTYDFKDYYIVSIIGFLVGWLVLLPAANIGLRITPLLVFISVAGFTVFAPIALVILNFLSRFWKVLGQFGKFAAVGTLNTLLDLGVLNLLIYSTDIAAGFYFSGFKAISFLVATTNSYFWNKFWTFQSRMPVAPQEYARFLFFTFIGTLINVSVASLIVNVIGPPAGFEPKLWANVGAVMAVFVAMLWNFLSYRHVVFRATNNQ
jgi:putative flippase GtrA